MKILICSRQTEFSVGLSRKLKKDKHEIYQITGESGSRAAFINHVFQSYHFEFNNKNVVRIMNNVKPDLVVVAGALDVDSRQESSQKKAIEYITDMSNILMCAKAANIKRVIYCSTMRIFEDNLEPVLNKNTKAVTHNFDTDAFAHIDSLYVNSHEEGGFEVEVIRFPEVYGNISKDFHVDDFSGKMLMQRLEGRSITYYAPLKHMVLSVMDATQLVANVIGTDNRQHIYMIESEICEESKVAEAIAELNANNNCQLEEKFNVAGKNPYPLEMEDSDNEALNFEPKYNIISQMSDLCAKYQKREVKKSEDASQEKLKKTVRGIVETVLLFIIMLAMELLFYNIATDAGINFLLIFVIIIAAVYGVSLAMFAAVLATVAELSFVLWELTEMSVGLDYTLYIKILQLVLCGVIVGLTRDNYKRKNADLEDINAFYVKELADVVRINDSNFYIKNLYEKRIANYKNSMSRIFNITSQLNFLDARKVMFQTAKVVSEIMETPHVALYVAGKNQGFYRLLATTSEKGLGVGKSVYFNEESYFYDALLNHDVYMNREMKSERPTFITGVYNQNDGIDAIIMIWATELEHVNLDQSATISVLSRLIEKNMNSAMQYEDVYLENAYIDETNIMKAEPFIEKLQVYMGGAQMNLTTFVVLQVMIPENKQCVDLFDTVQRLVRDTDYIGSDMENIYIILTNSNTEEARFVMDRFEKNELEVMIVDTKVLVKETF